MTEQPSGDPRQTMALSQYVEYRTGLGLGAKGSLTAMLRRSLGAGSFAGFWKHWNPIWGYYLGRYVHAPLRRFVPVWVAVIATFFVSGAIHDAAVWLFRPDTGLLFTPWFVLMGLMVVATGRTGFRYTDPPWPARAAINLAFVLGSLAVIMAGRRLAGIA